MRREQKRVLGAILLAALSMWAVTAPAAPAADGVRVYQNVCRHCHEVGIGPVIKGRNLPPEYVQHTVRHGNRAMPSFRASEIDDAALADVARLIASSAAGAPLGQ